MGEELGVVLSVDSIGVVEGDVELTAKACILVEESRAVVDTGGNVRRNLVSGEFLEVDVADGKTEADFAGNLKAFADRDAKIEKGTVIYAGDLKRSGNPSAINFRDTAEIIP